MEEEFKLILSQAIFSVLEVDVANRVFLMLPGNHRLNCPDGSYDERKNLTRTHKLTFHCLSSQSYWIFGLLYHCPKGFSRHFLRHDRQVLNGNFHCIFW